MNGGASDQDSVEQLLNQLRDVIEQKHKRHREITHDDLERLAISLTERIETKVKLLSERMGSLEKRIDEKDALLAEQFKNVRLQLASERVQHISDEIEKQVPAAVASELAERRRGFRAWVKSNASLLAGIATLLAGLMAMYIAAKGGDPDSASKVSRGFGQLK